MLLLFFRDNIFIHTNFYNTMKKDIKPKSLNQAVWRANVHLKNGTNPKWQHLVPEQVQEIIRLRQNEWTYKELAERFGVTIEAVRKHCIKAGLA